MVWTREKRLEWLCSQLDALDLDHEARAAFLHRYCPDDADLRREVTERVASYELDSRDSGPIPYVPPGISLVDIFKRKSDHELDDESGGSVDSSKPMGPMGPSGNHLDEVLIPGKKLGIGQYELVRQLGCGGMGVVFLARDIRLGRRVAIKFLSEENESSAEEFRAEARATARCKHENIVTVYDVGEIQGHSYMVLEYIEGCTLREWLDDHWQNEHSPGRDFALADTVTSAHSAVSVVVALQMIIPVVRALAHAHARGLVHRDLKPENIMLPCDGPIKVLDFGLATVLDPSGYSHITRGEGDKRSPGLRPDSRSSLVAGT